MGERGEGRVWNGYGCLLIVNCISWEAKQTLNGNVQKAFVIAIGSLSPDMPTVAPPLKLQGLMAVHTMAVHTIVMSPSEARATSPPVPVAPLVVVYIILG